MIAVHTKTQFGSISLNTEFQKTFLDESLKNGAFEEEKPENIESNIK